MTCNNMIAITAIPYLLVVVGVVAAAGAVAAAVVISHVET